MNDKDNEAFENWWMEVFKGMSEMEVLIYKNHGKHTWVAYKGWQAACLHKQKEIEDKLKAEKEKSLKLVEALNNWVEWENEQIKKDGEYISVRLNGLISNAKKALADYKKE